MNTAFQAALSRLTAEARSIHETFGAGGHWQTFTDQETQQLYAVGGLLDRLSEATKRPYKWNMGDVNCPENDCGDCPRCLHYGIPEGGYILNQWGKIEPIPAPVQREQDDMPYGC